MTKRFWGVALLALSCGAADWTGAYLDGRTVEGKCFYAPGERMTFHLKVGGIAALPAGSWQIAWTRTGDDGVTQTGTSPVSLTDPCVVTTSLDRAGFVHLAARVAGAPDSVRFNGGAGVNRAEIVANQGEPADFEDFWRNELAALACVPVNPVLTEIASPKAGVKLYTFRLDCVGEKPSTGYLSVPEAAGTFPARLLFYGYNQSWNNDVLQPPSAGALSATEIQLRVNAHGLELGRESAYYAAAKAAVSWGSNLHGWNPAENERVDTCYYRLMVLRDVRAAQYAQTLPTWNQKDLVVDGGSQGAFQSILVASLCAPRVTRAEVYINWLCDLRGKAFGGREGSIFQPAWRPGLDYFDEVFHARCISTNCYVNITYAGLGDYISPPSGLACFYNALRGKKRIVWRQNAEHSWSSSAPNGQSWVETAEISANPGPDVNWRKSARVETEIFKAAAATGQTVGGAWSAAPSVEQGLYRIQGAPSVFAVSAPRTGATRTVSRVRLDAGYAPAALPALSAAWAAAAPRGGLVLVAGNPACWMRVDATGALTRLNGGENPDADCAYEIAVETDAAGTCLSYCVGPVGGVSIRLADAAGNMWFACPNDTPVAEVNYCGEFRLADLAGIHLQDTWRGLLLRLAQY